MVEGRYLTANNFLSAISQKCITSLSFTSDIAMFKLVTLHNIKLKSHKNPGLFLWIKLAMAHMQKNLVSPLVWRDKLYNSLAVEEPAAMSDLMLK